MLFAIEKNCKQRFLIAKIGCKQQFVLLMNSSMQKKLIPIKDKTKQMHNITFLYTY
jgi:hypothetical protein